MSSFQTMSSSQPEQQQFCALFSAGIFCPQGRNCPFIHKWAFFNKARKERKLAKIQDSQRDDFNKASAQEHGNTSVDVPQQENIASCGSRNDTLIKTQGTEMENMLSITETKRIQPGNDDQSVKSGKSRGKNRGKQIWGNGDHVKTANSIGNPPKIGKSTHSLRPNQSLPNLSSVEQADRRGNVLNSNSAQYTTGNCVPGNTSVLSIKTLKEDYGLAKGGNHGDNQINTFGRQTTGNAGFRKFHHDQAGQAVKVRNERIGYNDGVDNKPFSNGVTDSKPLKKFTLFLELPFEIRLVIWQIAVRFPYNPVVRFHHCFDNTGNIIFRDLICQSLTPIVLRINRESRTEALKHFTLALGNTTYLHKPTGTVFLISHEPGDLTHFVASVPPQDLQTIRNLAVELCEWSWTGETFKQAVWQFTNIKRLIMMFSKSEDSCYLRKETYRTIARELKQPEENRTGWKTPIIGLVKSSAVEDFLKSNNFA